MFKKAFLSEYSLPNDEFAERILKAHLLSNESLIIPAATIGKTSFSKHIADNLKDLADGCISIAHGDDCNNLNQYIEKYPNINWESDVLEVFEHFNNTANCSIYRTSGTIKQFNSLMQRCALGKLPEFQDIFSNEKLCQTITVSAQFDLNQYFSIVEASCTDLIEVEKLKAHAKYFYNFFGSHSTNAGNTFSLENTDGFDHIAANTNSFSDSTSGLSILISCALDLTEGIEDFSFVKELGDDFLDKLSFSDIMDLRANWLHEEVINSYDTLVQNCASSYLDLKNGNEKSALAHIENAFEIRESIIQNVKTQVKSEVNAYKFHRASRALADGAITWLEFLSGANLVKSIATGIISATTEVAVIFNKETKLEKYKQLIRSKTEKVEIAYEKGRVAIGEKSPALEYLRAVNSGIKV